MMIMSKYNYLYNISHDVNEQKSTSLHFANGLSSLLNYCFSNAFNRILMTKKINRIIIQWCVCL